MSATTTSVAPATAQASRKPSPIKPVLWWLLAVVMVLPSLLPLLWLASASFKTYIQTQAIPPVWFPGWNLANYVEVLKGPRVDYFLNSAMISATTVVLVIVLAIPAAYGLSRFKTSRTRDLQFWIVSMRMIPPLAMVVPVYVYFSLLDLTGTRLAIICMLTMANGAFAVWLCTTFFDEVPVEVEEAARLDGLGHYQVFLRVALPLARTGVLTVLGFVFIFAWNELPFSLVLANQESQPFPVYLTTFNGTTFIDYGLMAAACMLYVAPVVAVTLLMQRQLVAGLSFGAVK
ncbi:MAG: carbohydrate ABC transporter permease [Beutenbergiaceae bacterium]